MAQARLVWIGGCDRENITCTWVSKERTISSRLNTVIEIDTQGLPDSILKLIYGSCFPLDKQDQTRKVDWKLHTDSAPICKFSWPCSRREG